MREACFSQLEHDFVLQALKNKKRCDERDFLDLRDLHVSFGLDYGCCTVSLGATKVMAQVAAEIERPRESRPSEGYLNVHVELSTIARASFDPSKPGELGVEIQRILERSIVFSRAVDLEELCIRVGERSWTLQLYLHVLCHDGNILDCACIAAITALKHFRRSDVTVHGQDVTVHTVEEKNPIPLTIHHMPLCTTFAFFKDCESLVFDPTAIEEKVMDGKLIISMNKHKEVCCLQMSGPLQFTRKQILHCTNIAYEKVKSLTDFVGRALQEDTLQKQRGEVSSLSALKMERSKRSGKDLTVHSQPTEDIPVSNGGVTAPVSGDTPEEGAAPTWLTKHSEQTATIGEGVVNTWSDVKTAGLFKDLRKEPTDEDDDDDSEDDGSDEETMTLEQTDVGSFET